MTSEASLCDQKASKSMVDERTSPGAYFIAKAYNSAVNDIEFQCPFVSNPTCDQNSFYRTYDGVCNNIQQPRYGSIETPHKRFLNPVYDDGQGTPKVKAVSGNNLPNPRLISKTIQSDNNVFEVIWSHIFIIFGQFLTHDIVSTALINRNLYFFDLK